MLLAGVISEASHSRGSRSHSVVEEGAGAEGQRLHTQYN